MAVTIADNRAEWSDCDTANWDGSAADQVFTSGPAPKELTGCLGFTVSQGEEYMYYTSTSIDLSSGVLVYIWVLVQGTGDSTTAGGIQILLGDGADRIGYYVAGADVAGFRHDAGGVQWQCVILDTTNLPAGYTEHTGTEATLTLTAITDIGAGFTVSSKALGGADNCFCDVIFYGNDGLTIIGGGTGTEGDFGEIASADASDTTGASSYGICRELGSGLFGLQGPLTFGNTGADSVDFYSTNETVVFEDRNIGTDRYYINVTGNTTGTTTFQLGTQVGSTTAGSNGTSLVCPAGVGASFNASNSNIGEVLLYGSSFSGFNNGIYFSADATNGPNHEIYGNSFNGCGQIDPGKTLFKNNSIGDTTNSGGALLIDSDGTSNISDLIFTSGGTGHGIYITSSGTHSFTNFTYSNYASTNGSTGNEVIYNNSGGLVTIQVSGGDTPTYRNGSGASTVISASYTHTITGLESGTEITYVTAGTSTELYHVESASVSDGDGKYKTTYTHGGGAVVDVLVFHTNYKPDISNIIGITLPNVNTTVKVQMFSDENYYNPA